jgi:uncharacterized DUF497 family protein
MRDRYADRIRIAPSARKHGVDDADMIHAVDHPIRYREQEYQGEERILIIGADRVGRLLEIVLVPAHSPSLIIHADRLPPGRYHYL